MHTTCRNFWINQSAHIDCPQNALLLKKAKTESTSTQSWRRCRLRANIASGYSRLDFNVYKDIDGLLAASVT